LFDCHASLSIYPHYIHKDQFRTAIIHELFIGLSYCHHSHHPFLSIFYPMVYKIYADAK
jgi:hypothetical protein